MVWEPWGPHGNLSRRLDWTRQQFSICSVLGHFMTAGLSEDYGPNKLQNHYAILIQDQGRLVVIGWDLPGSVGTGQYLWRSVRIC